MIGQLCQTAPFLTDHGMVPMVPPDHHRFSMNGGFHKWGYPIAGWFIIEHPIKIDDLGVPLFMETPIHRIYESMNGTFSIAMLNKQDDIP